MKIAFRVDASSKVGLGHIKRCLSLAEELRTLGAKVIFVARDLGVDIDRLVESASFPLSKLPFVEAERADTANEPTHAGWAGAGWHVDANQTVGALVKFCPDWVIVDHYAFDAQWHANVASRLNVRIAAIDDLGDRMLQVDVLIDHNVSADHRNKYAGRVSNRTRILGGPRFALLGPAYRKLAGYTFHDVVRSIGVFMGGADADDHSSRVVKACREFAGFTGPMEVATTRYNPNLRNLRVLAQRWPSTTITEDLPDLADFFARHDVQVGAGGGATWERAAVGAPSLLLVVAENQREVVSELTALGAVERINETGGGAISDIGEVIRKLISDDHARHELSIRSRQLVDGLGARRVALYLLRDEMGVRRADFRDAEMILEWRNHASVRSVSRESTNIDPEVHARWMKSVLVDTNRCLLIGRVGSIDVGVIRFDTVNSQCMEVSLYLDPALQNLGLGSAMLRAGEAYLRSHYSGGDLRLLATVLDDNMTSRKLFESNQYRFVDSHWEKTLIAAAKNQGGSC
jgi:UDP-2,4-diacetamido-2,4,6-trideoxy-beta-L-altropyranose hydrolase